MNKQRGFTLIEMLLVLQVIMMLNLFILPQTNLKIAQKEIIFHRIYLSIEKVRLNAMNSNENQTLYFENHELYFNQETLLNEKRLQFDSSSSITFNEQGHILKASTIYFSIGNKEYALIFNLGQGAYRIEET